MRTAGSTHANGPDARVRRWRRLRLRPRHAGVQRRLRPGHRPIRRLGGPGAACRTRAGTGRRRGASCSPCSRRSATLIVLLVLDGIWAGRTMFRGVSAARSAAAEGSVAVVTGDPGAAVPRVRGAAEAADSVASAAAAIRRSRSRRRSRGSGTTSTRSRRWPMRPAERPTPALAMAEAAASSAGTTCGCPAAEGDRRRRPGHHRAGDPCHRRGRGRARAPRSRSLEAADTGRLVGPGGRRRSRTRSRPFGAGRTIALDARDLVELLPRFLGGGAERRYLLAMQTLGRPQGTGGEVDLIGVLTADDGVLALDAPLSPADRGVRGDDGHGRRAGGRREPARRRSRSRVSASWTASLLTDSIWLADALWTTGSVDVADRDLPVNSDEAAEVLEREVFEGRDGPAAAARRAVVANAIVESYLAAAPRPRPSPWRSRATSPSGTWSSWPRRARERRILERLGAGGAPERHGPATSSPSTGTPPWTTTPRSSRGATSPIG